MSSVEKFSTDEVERRFNLITRNLEEIIGGERIKPILAQRRLSLYWGTATTGKPHVAYFVPLLKLADFLHADCEVTVLLADLHALLDNSKAPLSLLDARTGYYRELITSMLVSLGVPVDRLKFVRGTDYQLDRNYMMDVYRLSTVATLHDCKKAGCDVVKQIEHPFLSAFLYPGLQALDEEYLKVDAQFGGLDQRKIFTFAEKVLPILGYKKRIHLMNTMIPGLSGGKMSSSEEQSKIDILDSSEDLKRKINKSFCEEGNIEQNGLLSFCKYIIFPILQHKNSKIEFIIERKQEFGGNITILSYKDLEDQFKNKLIHPGDFKKAVFTYLDQILSPIRKHFETEELKSLISHAYGPSKSDKKDEHDSSILDLVIGQIVEFSKHPTEPKCHVFKISTNAKKPLVVCDYSDWALPESEILNRKVIVVRNVMPTQVGNIYSNALMFALKKFNTNEPSKPEILHISDENEVGSRVYFSTFPTSEKAKFKVIKTQDDFLTKFIENINLNDESAIEYYNGTLTSSVDVVKFNNTHGSIFLTSTNAN